MTGSRLTWAELPEHVRIALEELLGDHVAEAVSQPGGFSPGTADRVRLAHGGRAFVKAVSAAHNPDSPQLHRAEIAVMRALPPDTPAPRLLGAYDDGDWVALVIADVDGRHPRTPWRRDELAAVLAACHDLADRMTPAPPGIGRLADDLRDDLLGWERIRDDPPAALDPWAAARLDELCALGRDAASAVAGDTLSHTDLRDDNILLRPRDGGVVFIDWAWAMAGQPWLDPLLVLINVAFTDAVGDFDLEALAAEHCRTDRATVTAFLAGMAGFFTHYARLPPPVGLPTVRSFQRAQARTTLDWLRRRLP